MVKKVIISKKKYDQMIKKHYFFTSIMTL